MNNIIIYTRVSSKEQLDGTSLEVQEKTCRKYALDKGFEEIKVFVERGESAKTSDRTELRSLVEFVAKNYKNYCAVIVYKIDRLARNSYDYAQLKFLFNRYGLKLLSATENLEDTPVGRLMETQLAGFAQFDNEIRTERSTGGMREAVENGRYVWGAPLGYLNSGGRGKSNLLLDNPERVRLVRKIWELVDTGYTLEEARKSITKEGLLGRSGKPICKSQFHKMIRNKVYMGVIEKFGLSIIGNFKPIVEPELFKRVQYVLDNRHRNIPIYKKDNEDFPLRGVVLHDKCNKPMTASWNKGNGGRYANYHCTHCPKTNYRKELVEGEFVEFLKRFEYKPALRNALLMAIEANLRFRKDKQIRRRSVIEKALTSLVANNKQIAQKNFMGVINDNLAKEMLDDNQKNKMI